MAAGEIGQSPLVKVMTWNMAEGLGERSKIATTFDRIHQVADTFSIVALQEAHLPEGQDALDALLQEKFPDWHIVHFNYSHEPALRRTHGHTIMLSPEGTIRQTDRRLLPAASEIYDLLVEEKHQGRRRGILIAAVDIPHGDSMMTIVVANAHLDLDVRGGKEHKGRQVQAVSKAVQEVKTIAHREFVSDDNREFALIIAADFNSGRRPGRRWHTRKMERIERHLGDAFVEATNRVISASIPRSVELFLASTESEFIHQIFHEESLLHRGLRHMTHRYKSVGGRSLDHVYTSTNLIPGEWFEIDEGASDHKVIGVTLFTAPTEQKRQKKGVDNS